MPEPAGFSGSMPASAAPESKPPRSMPPAVQANNQLPPWPSSRQTRHRSPQPAELLPDLRDARAKLVRRESVPSPPGRDTQAADGGAKASPFGVVLKSTPRQTPRSRTSSPDREVVVLKSAQETRVRNPKESPSAGAADAEAKEPPAWVRNNKPATRSPTAVQPYRSPTPETPAASDAGASESSGLQGAESNRGDAKLQSFRTPRAEGVVAGPSWMGASTTNSPRQASPRHAPVAPSSMRTRESPRSKSRGDAEQTCDRALWRVRKIDSIVKAEVVVSDSPWRTDAESSNGTLVPTSYLVRAQQNAIQLHTLQRHLETLVKENSIQAEFLRKHETTIAANKAERVSGLIEERPTCASDGIATLQAQLASVQGERDTLQRAVMQLEEALRNRNEEVRALVTRTQELEANMIQKQLSPGVVTPTWEERLMRRGSGSPFLRAVNTVNAPDSLKEPHWEDDIAGNWITAMTQTILAIESSLQDSSNTLRLKLQGEASLSRQIRVLQGRLEEFERRNRAREHDAGQVLLQCEFLGKAHIHILEKDLQEARRTIKLGGVYDLMQTSLATSLETMKQQLADKPTETDPLVAAMHACTAEAHRQRGSHCGTLAALDLSGRALASAWMAIKERDAKVHVLQSEITRANFCKNSGFMSIKGKEAENQRLLALVQQKEDLLKAWIQRYESEIEKMQAGHRAAEATLLSEIGSLKSNMALILSYYNSRQGGNNDEAAFSQQLVPQVQQSPVNAAHTEVSSLATRSQSSPGRGAKALSMFSSALKMPSRSSKLHVLATGDAHVQGRGQASAQVEAMRHYNEHLSTLLVESSPAKGNAIANGTHTARVESGGLNDGGEARKLEQVQGEKLIRASSGAVQNPAATEPRPTYFMSSRGPSPRRRPPRGVD